MEVDLRIAAPLLGWLASGLAALALTPRNRTAQLLFAAGALLTGSWIVEGIAASTAQGTSAAAVARVSGDLLHLSALAAIVALLSTYPEGRLDSRVAGRVVLVMATLAILAPLAQLAGSSRLLLGGDVETASDNPLAVSWLEPLGTAGHVVVTSEPTWLLVGVGLLVLRISRTPPGHRRRELVRLLAALGLLAAMLFLVVLSFVSGVGDGVSTALFLLALGVFPTVLLMGLSRQARRLAADLEASRARLAAAEDEARRTIERDLHDGVQQQLVALLSLTELAVRQVQRDPVRAAQTLGDVRLQAQRSIDDLRELVSGIRPPVLSDSGVVAALESRLTGLPAWIEVDADAARGLRWPAGIEAAAYFVACEAVANSLKHAPGSRVRVTIGGGADRLVVEVCDDGPGIRHVARGTGLAGLQDRVASWGGRFEVGAGLDGGTRVTAELPVGSTR